MIPDIILIVACLAGVLGFCWLLLWIWALVLQSAVRMID